MKRLLITGGSGYLGRKLVQKAREDWSVIYTFLNNPVNIPGATGIPLDILDREQVALLFREFRPDAVIHTAYSQNNLDVIVEGTQNIASASQHSKARLVHISTDAVFDGERGWYREDDTPNPIHPYGKAKAKAELSVGCAAPLLGITQSNRAKRGSATALTGSGATIVRTSLIWGLSPLDPRTLYIRDCLAEGKDLALFTDEYRCPILVDELASAILELLNLDFQGIIHVAGSERMSRYEFGMKLAEKLELNSQGVTPALSQFSELVRPKDCSLDTSLARNLLRTRISGASELLESKARSK